MQDLHRKAAPMGDKNVNITLPDGSVRSYGAGVTGLEVADSIAKSLAKAAVGVKINGVLSDLSLPIQADAKLEIVRRQDDAALEMIRHDAAHVMAEAVQKLYPGTQVTIGPTLKTGFITTSPATSLFRPRIFPAIEKEMRKIVERGAPFTREVWDRDEAIKFFKNKGENYKAELIQDLPETEEIKIYKQGEWTDLCRGPHMPTTKHVGNAFKLLKVAGAYWRGDSKQGDADADLRHGVAR
jgi:threonyl-tRNA synthetase